MPEFNQLQTGRFDLFVKRMGAVRNGGIMAVVAPELVPVIPMPALEEQLLAAGYGIVGFGGTVAAVAAQYAYAAVNNGSTNQLMVVHLQASADVAANWWLAVYPTTTAVAPLAAGNTGWLDTRRAPTTVPASTGSLLLGTGNSATVPPATPLGGFGVQYQVALANTQLDFTPVVLKPGTSCAVIVELVNQGIRYGGQVAIRDCTPDELTNF